LSDNRPPDAIAGADEKMLMDDFKEISQKDEETGEIYVDFGSFEKWWKQKIRADANYARQLRWAKRELARPVVVARFATQIRH
jgi:hypothetical protein